MIIEIAPSILSADFTKLGEEIACVEKAGASYIHIDVMDGHFVPNLTMGPFIVKQIRKVTKLPIDVHLMIENPDNFIGAFAEAGADMISVHPEAVYHLHRTISYIKSSGSKAGAVLNPATPLSAIEEIIDDLDYVLLMSVNPGFGGQAFIQSSLDKLHRLRNMIRSRGLSVKIEIDGGISVDNVVDVVKAGAEILVAGSSVFGKPDPAKALRDLIDAAHRPINDQAFV